MPRKKNKSPFDHFDIRLRGVETMLPYVEFSKEIGVAPLPLGIQKLIDFLGIQKHKSPEEMYCFIMYDIEDNKVRRLVAKYLEKKGCMRVQKSIFFAKLHRNKYREVTQTLKEIQEAYLNNDSILALPVGEDMLNSLLIIGKELTYEFDKQERTTLFF
jgi:CRISPR-associated protein Cas2